MSRPILLATLALTLPATSYAFCGTYLGSAGTELYNQSSQVVIARDGSTTHLTLVNDYQGTAADFAMVVPVPSLLGPSDVALVDPSVLARIDAYSAPRLVGYTCEELHPYGNGNDNDNYYRDTGYDSHQSGGSSGCFGRRDNQIQVDTTSGGFTTQTDTDVDGTPLTPDAIDSVEVEAEFVVGEYDIVVLSAEESADLILWLNLSGYAIPADTEALLGEYIDAGSYFIAAKVSLDAVESEARYLSPIRISYEADTVSLPIRLGALNSPGSQDLTVFVINDSVDGRAAISNLAEVVVEDECMYDPAKWDSFGEFYASQVDTAMNVDSERGVWTNEYSWEPTKCDPCTDDGAIDEADARALGYMMPLSMSYFTRLLVRYTPEQATQDLMLYSSAIHTQEQARYIAFDDKLGADFPVCGEGWTATGSCENGPPPAIVKPEPSPLPGRAGLFLLGLALVAKLRRNRA